MKQLIFAIFDAMARAYITPFLLPTMEMAKRSFTECANDPDHMFCKHPKDFTLHCLGEFDSETGAITSTTPTLIGSASQFKIQGE